VLKLSSLNGTDLVLQCSLAVRVEFPLVPGRTDLDLGWPVDWLVPDRAYGSAADFHRTFHFALANKSRDPLLAQNLRRTGSPKTEAFALPRTPFCPILTTHPLLGHRTDAAKDVIDPGSALLSRALTRSSPRVTEFLVQHNPPSTPLFFST